MTPSSPEPVLRHVYAFWGSAILAASLKHGVFMQLAGGARTADELARRAGVSVRGSQALLDGLLGLGLVERVPDGYANSIHATTYLVPGTPQYLGGYADMILATMADWSRLPESVATGRPLHVQERADPANRFWEHLVRALAPLCFEPARAAAARLGIADSDGFRMLDVGGGAGAYSAVWLGLNARGRCVQVDWPNVNAIARQYVGGFGHDARFETLDGDMETIDIEPGTYDCVIYSNVAHGLSPERNTRMFGRMRTWLKERGTLVICGLIPDPNRAGDPLQLLCAANLLLNTEHGALHAYSDYEAWLHATGFKSSERESVLGLAFGLIYAT